MAVIFRFLYQPFFIKTHISNRVRRLSQGIWPVRNYLRLAGDLTPRMQNATKHTIFKTRWGHFGLVGTEKGLLRTYLPRSDPQKIERRLSKDFPHSRNDNGFLKPLQQQIIAYFEGTYVNFNLNIPILLSDFGAFAKKVLLTCRRVRFGRTISYGQLAKKAGSPAAARAAGSVMAKNPFPLIIPCHRVIRSNGRIGGFSAPGGTKLKNRLLQFEQKELRKAVRNLDF